MNQNKAANIMAALTVLCSVLCTKSAEWGIFCYALFLPFFLIEWLYFKRRPSFAMNHWAGWGLAVFAVLLALASVLGGSIEDLRKMTGYFKYTLPFFMMLYLYNTFSVKKGIKIGVLLAMAVLSLYGLYEWTAGAHRVMTSIYRQHNTFAMALELLIPCGAIFAATEKDKKIKWSMAFMTVLCLICLFLSDSRGGILGLAGGVVFAILTKVLAAGKISLKKIGMALAVCAIVGGAGVFITVHINETRGSDSGGERVMMLEASYQMWKDHKVSGVGLAKWQKNYYGPYRPEGQHEQGLDMPHNMFLFFLSTTGFFGFAGYIAYLLFTYKAFWSGLRQAHDPMLWAGLIIFMAFLCHGFVDGTLISEKSARIYFALMGYMMALTAEKAKIKVVES